MAKIILGQPPKEFSRALSFLQVDGSDGSLTAKFKYRTRTEFAKFNDELIEKARAAATAEVDQLAALAKQGHPLPDMTHEAQLQREARANVDYVMGCLNGWDLAVPFDRAAVEQLADEVPAAMTAIVSAYAAAIIEGRQGN